MTGESNLPILLRTMQPELHESRFGFFSVSSEIASELLNESLCHFRESEGVTLILSYDAAERHSLTVDQPWALITLNVHSSLLAVGFLAAISNALASSAISLNAISAFYHDHLFVPWHQRFEALAVLKKLIDSQPGA